MPSYLYIFRGGKNPTFTPDQIQAHLAKWGAWVGHLAKSGNHNGGDPLEDAGRVLSGTNKTVTDGPYGETKDLVGGYLLVTAPNLDGATELARGCPIFEAGGSLEIRELRSMSM